jgi:hypothetical protein
MTTDGALEKKKAAKWVRQARQGIATVLRSEVDLIKYLTKRERGSICIEVCPHYKNVTPALAPVLVKDFFQAINSIRFVDRRIYKKSIRILLFVERTAGSPRSMRMIFLLHGIDGKYADLLWDLLWQELGRAEVYPTFEPEALGRRLFRIKSEGRLARFVPIEVRCKSEPRHKNKSVTDDEDLFLDCPGSMAA